MNRYGTVLAALVFLVVPAVCHAAPAESGAYFSGFLGVSVPTESNVSGTDFINGQSFDDRVEYDPGIYLGGTGGYDFGFLRLEGEMSYRYAEINRVRDLASNVRYRGVDGNLGVFAMMANAFVDLHNASPVTPYLGGGVGFAAMHLSDTFGINTASGALHRYGEGDDTVFAYQAGAGLEIALNRRSSLDVGYRYFRTNRADFDSDRDIDTSLRFESHNAALGFRYRF